LALNRAMRALASLISPGGIVRSFEKPCDTTAIVRPWKK
jgi:hypothetical protein